MNDRRLFVGALLATTFLALFWRPLTLGFLTDDWSVLVEPTVASPSFSYQRWNLLEIAQNRPFLRLLLFVLTSVLPPDPVAWHVAGALLNATAAAAVGRLAFDVAWLLERPAQSCCIAGIVAYATMLVLPFSAATQFWPTGTTATPSVGLFAVSSSLILRGWEGRRSLLYAGAAVSLVGYLTYEAFYLQFLPVVALAVWMRGNASGALLPTFAGYGGAQIVAALFGRIMRWLGAEGSRGVNIGFIDTYFHWYLYVGRFIGLGRVAVYAILVAGAVLAALVACKILRARQISVRFPVALAVSTLCVAAAGILVTIPLSMIEGLPLVVGGLGYIAWHGRSTRGPGAVPAALFVLAGLCLSALPFALGNYVIFSIGPGARATLAAGVWLVLGLGLLTAFASDVFLPRAYIVVAAGFVWLGLLVSDGFRAADWSHAGQLMTQIFDEVPSFPFGEPGPDAFFILVPPERPGRVPVIEVNHHVASISRLAFGRQVAALAQRAEMDRWTGRWIAVRSYQWRTTWDGSKILQIDCRSGETLESIAATEVWIWNQSAHTISRADAPTLFDCVAPSTAPGFLARITQ